MKGRHVEAIYCDDIRNEIGNKLSLIGVYGSDMYVRAFPITLARLCIVVKVVTPVELPFESLGLRVLKDDEILQEVTVGDEDLASAAASASASNNTESDNSFIIIQFNIAYSPLAVEGQCKLSLLAVTESEELKGPALRIQLAPQQPSD